MRAGGNEKVEFRRHPELEGLESFGYEGPAKHLAQHIHEEFQLVLTAGAPHQFESHLGRSFVAVLGVSPGHYQQCVAPRLHRRYSPHSATKST